MLSMIFTFSIISIYIKTEHIKATALLWSLMFGVIILLSQGLSLGLILVPIVYFIGLGLFKLVEYFEDTILARLFALVFAMFIIYFSFGGKAWL